MKEWRTMCKKLLFPPVPILILLSIFSVASLIFVFAKGLDQLPVSAAVYVVSFYWVVVMVAFFSVTFPPLLVKLKQKILAHELGRRYMTDPAFKTLVSLSLSLLINLAYVAMNIYSGFVNQSFWFAILALYYSILAIMRFLLLRFYRGTGIGTDRIKELRQARTCACILLTLTISLSGSVLMMVHQNRGFHYNGILIYVMAMYTFYSTTMAIINIVKYRKHRSPVMSTAKVINLAAALVSMLSLETAMFSQFGADMTRENQKIMLIATGAGICVIITIISLMIVLWANKEIRAGQTQKTSEK